MYLSKGKPYKRRGSHSTSPGPCLLPRQPRRPPFLLQLPYCSKSLALSTHCLLELWECVSEVERERERQRQRERERERERDVVILWHFKTSIHVYLKFYVKTAQGTQLYPSHNINYSSYTVSTLKPYYNDLFKGEQNCTCILSIQWSLVDLIFAFKFSHNHLTNAIKQLSPSEWQYMTVLT